jgi:signal transduction histidine kinase/ligand-binding sensor domain-containing protein
VRFFLIFLGICICISDNYAQFVFNHYTVDDGLIANEVSCTYRDSRGFLWIGARNGLQVYNGKYFREVRHNLLDSNSLSGDWVMSIAEDADGFIWVSTDKGICKIHPGHLQCTRYKPGSNIPAGVKTSYSKLVADHTGKIWAITSNYLLELQNDRFNKVAPVSNAGCIAKGVNNNLLFACFDGIYEMELTTRKIQPVPLTFPQKMDRTTLYQDKNGNIWMGTWGEGVFLLDKNLKEQQNFKWDLNPVNPSTTNIISFISGDDRYVYVGTNNGLYIYSIDRSVDLAVPYAHLRYEVDNRYGISSSLITHVYVDKQDNLWITSAGGLDVSMALNREYHLQAEGTGFTTDHIWRKKKLIASSWYGKGLYFFNDSMQPVKTVQYLPENQTALNNSQISGLDMNEQGELWVATFNGLVKYDPVTYRSLEYITKEKNGLATNRLNDVWVNKAENTVWTANYDAGISIYNIGTGLVSNLSMQDHPILRTNLVWSFYDDHKGIVWILTNSGIVQYNYIQKTWKSWSYIVEQGNNVEIGKVNALLKDSKGIIWLGTENGLFLYIHDRWYFKGLEYGLPERSINGIVEDKKGNIWLGFDHSLVSYDPRTSSALILSINNGILLPPIHFIFMDPYKDQLYLVSDNRIYQINKDNLLQSHTESPAVYLEKFQINNRSYYSSTRSFDIEKNNFSYSQNNVAIEFATPSIGEIGKLLYSYRIGSVGTWSTPSENNRIILPQLQPGSYKVEIRATTDGTHWSKTPLLVNFTIHPPFWATWWFRTLIGSLVIIILILLVRFISTRNLRLKILQLEKDQAIEKERSRLSRDMHDDLGSGLTKISILTEVVRKKISKDDQVDGYLENISGSSRELVQNLNNIIWSLNPGNQTWNALLAYIREYSAGFLESCQVDFEFNAPQQAADLVVSEQVKRNIFLVVKEALNNAVKHGRATRVILSVQETSTKKFVLKIVDNGSGTDLKKVQKGNGLKNMEKRMKEIGGEWEIQSEEGKETTVTLRYSF